MVLISNSKDHSTMTITRSPDFEELLSPAKVAELLGVRVQTLATWRTGRGPRGLQFVKIGSSIRYRRGDVLAFIEARRVSNTTQGAHL